LLGKREARGFARPRVHQGAKELEGKVEDFPALMFFCSVVNHVVRGLSEILSLQKIVFQQLKYIYIPQQT
jgi:hypothetical protein